MRTNPSTYNEMRDRARHSPHDYLRWRDKDGTPHFERSSPTSMKAAMLATGTRGSFTLFSARSGVAIHMTWPVAVCVLANLRLGRI